MRNVQKLVDAIEQATPTDLFLFNRMMAAAADETRKAGQPRCADCVDAVALVAAEALLERLADQTASANDPKIAVPPGARVH